MRGVAGGSAARRGVQSWSARLREVREDWPGVAVVWRRGAGAWPDAWRAWRRVASAGLAGNCRGRVGGDRKREVDRLDVKHDAAGWTMSGTSVRGSECAQRRPSSCAVVRGASRACGVRGGAEDLRGGIGAAEAAPRGARRGILSRRRRVARGRCGAPAVRLRACAAAPGARAAPRGVALAALVGSARAREGRKSQALPGRCGPRTGNAFAP